jgi:GNAT superfamily N-acetyltransferase
VLHPAPTTLAERRAWSTLRAMRVVPEGYAIRLAEPGDLESLPEIERAAATRFAPWGLDALFASATTPLAELETALCRGHLTVATHVDRAVGFAMMSRIDWHANLDEIDVLPEHGGLGLGRALVDAVIAIARREGRGRITLSTMRAVPFNAPWYARLGFREMTESELGAGMRTVFARELAFGFPMEHRVLMALDLGPPGGVVRSAP